MFVSALRFQLDSTGVFNMMSICALVILLDKYGCTMAELRQRDITLPPGVEPPPGLEPSQAPGPSQGNQHPKPPGSADRFTTVITTTMKYTRTMPRRESQLHDCDYLAHYCLRAYRTGKLCGRTLYYKYRSFTNYCLLDYVNCREGYEVWQLVHMGECFTLEEVEEYKHYVYDDDKFLDQVYVFDY